MATSITAEEKTILELFAKTNRYIIPSYQRSYSWGDKECTELWEDLLFVFDNDRDSEYFLGNIVVAQSKERKEIIEVIDGQQRLITLTLILKVINLVQEHRDLAEAIFHTDRDTDKQTPRVMTRVYENNDKEHFPKVLGLKNGQDIEAIDLKQANQFEENIYFFYQQLKEFDDDKKRAFRNFLFDKVNILSIQSVDLKEERAREKALVIFETINNRGLDLSDADIFKSQLYNSALNKLKHEHFEVQWSSLVELVKTNGHEIDDVFRVYTHILRGYNEEIGTEIGLRAFFSQEIENEKNQKPYYRPLRKQDYQDVMQNLYKIAIVMDTFNQCIKNGYDNQHRYSEFTKWFQVIDAYSNSYPRFVIFVYLYYNSSLDNSDKLILNDNQIDDLLLLSQNIIRYSYPHTSSMKIKFEIFKMIREIANNRKYNFADKIEKLKKDDFFSLRVQDGRKNGLTLLAIYLDKQQQAVDEYYFHTIITNQNKKDLNQTWTDEKIKSSISSIGNLLLTDFKRKTQALNQRVEAYKTSKVIDLQNLSTKLSDFNYNDFKEREELLSRRLEKFFSSDTLW